MVPLSLTTSLLPMDTNSVTLQVGFSTTESPINSSRTYKRYRLPMAVVRLGAKQVVDEHAYESPDVPVL